LFTLLLGFAFSAVPVMVLLVTGVQARIGSPAAALAQPRWQNTIVYVLWGLMAAGSAIAIPAAILLGGFADFGLDPGASHGTLVARPGMSIAEVKRASTLPIDAPDDAPAIGEGVVFDFEVAGTGIRLPRCRYYFASTYTHDRAHIEGMSIGASTAKATRAEVEAADERLRRALVVDGWRAGHEVYGSEEDRALHGGAERGPEGDLWLRTRSCWTSSASAWTNRARERTRPARASSSRWSRCGRAPTIPTSNATSSQRRRADPDEHLNSSSRRPLHRLAGARRRAATHHQIVTGIT
jgi:hypothetical protein